MFITKHVKVAENLSLQISGRTVRKEYIVQVKGEFPAETAVCNILILQILPKLGLNQVQANGKAAKTVFHMLVYYLPTTPETQKEPDILEQAKLKEDRL
jgi:tRNA pseudouridine synthase 9